MLLTRAKVLSHDRLACFPLVSEVFEQRVELAISVENEFFVHLVGVCFDLVHLVVEPNKRFFDSINALPYLFHHGLVEVLFFDCARSLALALRLQVVHVR